MNIDIPINMSQDLSIKESAQAHLQRHQLSIWRGTDRLFACLLAVEWIAGMALAFWRSPLTWDGPTNRLHPHVWAAIFLGAAIVSLPIVMAILSPGKSLTRHLIAASQMLMSGLFIHLGDGRIEMHFSVFGSLAFLAFYRNWRVMVTATVVVALDHLLRGLLLPQSIYGVATPTLWRTFEHAFWVVFEVIFLVGASLQAVSEMHGIAMQRALLEHSYHDVEQKVQERTEELANAQSDLVKAARSAGMAEIATSVLHNVGNVLNSVNVSATMMADRLRQSEVPSLTKVSELIEANKPRLGEFLTADERGKLVPSFIADLANCLNDEQAQMLAEVQSLTRGIDHIKQVVAAQQSMAKKSNVRTSIKPAAVFESALAMQSAHKSDVTIIKNYIDSPPVMIDQHKVLEILINLISNARQAVAAQPPGHRTVTLTIERRDTSDGERLRFAVIDNGMGIAKENLTRIFSHGFTTKQDGHGFGLHSAANAAREMGGSLTAASEGPHKGAAFTLELPIEDVKETVVCN